MDINKIKTGIEIEVENAHQEINVQGWRGVHEAMLRGGIEYVFRQPTPYEDNRKLLNNLFKKFTGETFSQRCGIHVHVDVRDFDRKQLFNFITLYVSLEPLLLKALLPEGRLGNNFCLPVGDALSITDFLLDCAVKQRRIEDAGLNQYKYGAMNIASVGNLGSLEFRAFHGTKDVDELMYWVDCLVTLAKKGFDYEGTPADLMMLASREGVQEFAKLLPDNPRVHDRDDLEHLVYEGVRNAQTYAFLGDWT